jgi:signal transduction histidine kinase
LRAIEAFAGRVAASAHDRLEPGEREQLQRVRDAATRMAALLEALNDWSHATRAPLARRPVDLSLLAEWAIADQCEAEPGRAVESYVQPALATVGDERLLRRLFDHLVANAWQFAAPGEAVRVDIRGEVAGRWLRVTVADRGIGFDPRHAHKLFEPLQRLHGPLEGARHGLGLAVAQVIVQRHGGTITADSQPGDGARFTVHLPRVDGEGDDA